MAHDELRDELGFVQVFRPFAAAGNDEGVEEHLAEFLDGTVGAERDVILWNTVPHHPHRPGEPLSNRRPTAAEIAAGAVFARRAIELLQPELVIAVGRVAEAAAGDLAQARVRHPANGGASQFADGMREILRT